MPDVKMREAEALALAVLRGDRGAAVALADMIMQDPTEVPDPVYEPAAGSPTGGAVFRWPEFRAFARRLGVPLDSRIKTLAFALAADSVVAYRVTLAGDDNGGTGAAQEEQEDGEGPAPGPGHAPPDFVVDFDDPEWWFGL